MYRRLLLKTMIAGSLAGSLAVAAGPSWAQENRLPIRLAHQYPVTTQLHQGVEVFANYFNEHNSRFKISIFPNGQLYTEKGLVQGVQTGALDISFTTPSAWGGTVPAIYVMNVPMLLGTPKLGQAAMSGKFGKGLTEEMEKQGIKIVAWLDYGLDNVVVTTAKPIKTAEDFKGLRIRASSPLHGIMIEALGAGPVILSSSEVYMALQRGTFDGTVSSMISTLERKWNEVAKYVTLMPISYVSEPLAVSKRLWNQLTPDEQKVMLEAGRIAAEKTAELTRQIEVKMRAELGRTMTVYEMPADEARRIAELTRPAALDYIKKVAGEPGVQLVGYAEEDIKNVK